MRIVGLTGGIATGKSTVSEILVNLGVPIIDSDRIAREVVEPGEQAFVEISEEFGAEVLNKNGTLNRQALGRIVFNNTAARNRLEQITHPRIMQKIKHLLADYKARGEKIVVLDAPLLIEAGLHRAVEEVWLVVCDEKLQLERLIKRSGHTEEHAQARISSQMPLREKVRYADVIIDNSSGVQELREKVVSLWQNVLLQE